MSDERVAERFKMALPVYDTMADDEELMRDLEGHVAAEMWDDAVHGAGGELYGRPLVSRMDNPSYGEPILDEDGEPLTNGIKLYLMADGWAIRR